MKKNKDTDCSNCVLPLCAKVRCRIEYNAKKSTTYKL